MSSTATPTQALLLEKIDPTVKNGDDLWNILHLDRKSEFKPLVRIAEQIIQEWWALESAETSYAQAIASVRSHARRQSEALQNGERADASWVMAAALDAQKHQAKMEEAIRRFRNFAALRALLLEEASN